MLRHLLSWGLSINYITNIMIYWKNFSNLINVKVLLECNPFFQQRDIIDEISPINGSLRSFKCCHLWCHKCMQTFKLNIFFIVSNFHFYLEPLASTFRQLFKLKVSDTSENFYFLFAIAEMISQHSYGFRCGPLIIMEGTNEFWTIKQFVSRFYHGTFTSWFCHWFKCVRNFH